MKSFSLAVILTFALQCGCPERGNFTVIYSVKDKVLVRESGSFNTPIELNNFGKLVTGLAVYKDYVYVSVKRSLNFYKNSAVLRGKITKSPNFRIDSNRWDEIHVLNGAKTYCP